MLGKCAQNAQLLVREPTCFKQKDHIGFTQFSLPMDIKSFTIQETPMVRSQLLEQKDGSHFSTHRSKPEENGEHGSATSKSEEWLSITRF